MHFITLKSLPKRILEDIVERAVTLKRGAKSKEVLKGKHIGLIFEKPSTRTRVSFEVAIAKLGGVSTFMATSETQLSRGEPIEDTAKVLSRYLDFIVFRALKHESVVKLAANSSIPVINALSDLYHPCQILSDVALLLDMKGKIEGLRICYLGDGNNIANTLCEGAGIFGYKLTIACPEGYEPLKNVTKWAQIEREPFKAVEGADVIYTDVWFSMGQKRTRGKLQALKPYRLDMDKVRRAKSDVFIMHCLPRGEEITEEVLSSPNSVIFEQAEMRLWGQTALFEILVSL